MQPIVSSLDPIPDLPAAFRRFCKLPGCLLLDSSMQIATRNQQLLGRYSFLMADPFEWIEVPVGSTDPLTKIRDLLRRFQTERLPELPPMQGGLAGMLSYDLNRSFESIRPQGIDQFQIPALVMGCYDLVVAWDHQQQQAWVISTGFPELEPSLRLKRAEYRIAEAKQWLRDSTSPENSAAHGFHQTISNPTIAEDLLLISQRRYPVSNLAGLTSNFSREQYLQTIQKCIDYIRAGDVFQINLAQQLLYPANVHASDLYLNIRRHNPAPFSGYFDTSRIANESNQGNSAFQIISASPERLVAARDRKVETRPIKGTRRRTGNPMVDIYHQQALLGSIKDRAENTMIVDLMRNDFSRFCTDDSIEVMQLCELEKYQSVLHLVSAVEGRMSDIADLVDLIEGVFPGGSITGAPKCRAMEIIAELEPNVRGPYCGSLGYLGFNGDADLNILIRTITAKDGWWQIPVGGGIVSQSNPAVEYEETWIKAASMLQAISAPQAELNPVVLT